MPKTRHNTVLPMKHTAYVGPHASAPGCASAAATPFISPFAALAHASPCDRLPSINLDWLDSEISEDLALLSGPDADDVSLFSTASEPVSVAEPGAAEVSRGCILELDPLPQPASPLTATPPMLLSSMELRQYDGAWCGDCAASRSLSLSLVLSLGGWPSLDMDALNHHSHHNHHNHRGCSAHAHKRPRLAPTLGEALALGELLGQGFGEGGHDSCHTTGEDAAAWFDLGTLRPHTDADALFCDASGAVAVTPLDRVSGTFATCAHPSTTAPSTHALPLPLGDHLDLDLGLGPEDLAPEAHYAPTAAPVVPVADTAVGATACAPTAHPPHPASLFEAADGASPADVAPSHAATPLPLPPQPPRPWTQHQASPAAPTPPAPAPSPLLGAGAGAPAMQRERSAAIRWGPPAAEAVASPVAAAVCWGVKTSAAGGADVAGASDAGAVPRTCTCCHSRPGTTGPRGRITRKHCWCMGCAKQSVMEGLAFVTCNDCSRTMLRAVWANHAKQTRCTSWSEAAESCGRRCSKCQSKMVPLSEFGEGGEGGSCMRHRADCTDPAPTATASSAPASRAPSPSAPAASSSPATSSSTSCAHPSCACDAAAKGGRARAARPKAVGRKRGGAATSAIALSPPSVTPACAPGPCAGPVPFVSAPACCVCLSQASAQAQSQPHGFVSTNLGSGGAVTKPLAAPCVSVAAAAASVCVPAAARTLACAAGDGAGCGGWGVFEHSWNDEPFSTHVSGGSAGNAFNVGASGCCA